MSVVAGGCRAIRNTSPLPYIPGNIRDDSFSPPLHKEYIQEKNNSGQTAQVAKAIRAAGSAVLR